MADIIEKVNKQLLRDLDDSLFEWAVVAFYPGKTAIDCPTGRRLTDLAYDLRFGCEILRASFQRRHECNRRSMTSATTIVSAFRRIVLAESALTFMVLLINQVTRMEFTKGRPRT